MPRVSVVIPAHTSALYLRSALQSVLDQEFTDWEIIVVDDGSQEDFSHLIHGFRDVKLIKNERRCGSAFSRNMGINNSSAELIAFLDHDDLWHSTKLMRQIEAIEADPAIALCYTDYEVIDQSGCVVRTDKRVVGTALVSTFSAGSESFSALAKVHVATTSCVMVRRSALVDCGLFDQSLICCEDFDLWLRLCSKYKSAFVNSIEVGYRTHPAQMTRSEYYISSDDDERVWLKYEEQAHRNNDQELAKTVQVLRSRTRRSYAAIAYDNARTAYSRGHFNVMCKFLTKSIALGPQLTVVQMWLWLANRVPGLVRADKMTPLENRALANESEGSKLKVSD